MYPINIFVKAPKYDNLINTTYVHKGIGLNKLLPKIW